MSAPTNERGAADAIAAAVGPGAAVLVIGRPLPGLGAALDARGCTVTVLGPAGHPVAEAWVRQSGAVDEVRPDLGSLGAFDAIVAPHLLDRAADPAATLARIAAALGVAGRVVLAASRPEPAGALHHHDPAQVERLCALAGLAIQAATEVASTTVVVARRVTGTPGPLVLAPEEPFGAAVTVAVDRRLRHQQASIRALEDEVRALRAAAARPGGVRALARAVRARIAGP